MQQQGIATLGLNLANEYRQTLCTEPLDVLNEEQFATEQATSWLRQREIEAADKLSFEQYLAQHNAG